MILGVDTIILQLHICLLYLRTCTLYFTIPYLLFLSELVWTHISRRPVVAVPHYLVSPLLCPGTLTLHEPAKQHHMHLS